VWSTDAGAEDDDNDKEEEEAVILKGAFFSRTLTLATRFPDVINIFTCSFLFGGWRRDRRERIEKEQRGHHNTQKHLIFGVTKNRCRTIAPPMKHPRHR
jgi:hypothetical protein